MRETAQLQEVQSDPQPAGLGKQWDARALVRHLAHELRQPLSAIESVAFCLRMGIPRHDARAREQLGKLHALVSEMDGILSDAVHFLQAVPRDPRPVDLRELFAGAAQSVPGDDAPVAARLDPVQAQHLRRALMRFATLLSPGPEAACVRVRAGSGEARVEVEIPGIEVSAEDFSSMCAPLGSELPAGSGWSLASACRIVEAHGGRLRAYSKPGATTVLVSLPLA